MPFPFQQIQQLDMGRQQMERNSMLLEAAKRAQAARGPAMQMLYDTMGGQAQPQGAMPPPPPQQPAPQPGAMSAGGGNPMAQGGASMMAPPQPQAQPPSPLKIAPFQPLPSATATPQPMGGGQVPPPPQAAPQQPQAPAGKQFDLKTIIGNLKQAGVPPEKAMDMLETLTPVMSAENKRELELHKTENAALRAATQAYTSTINAMARERDSQTRADAEVRRTEQGNARISILKAKAEAAAQGSGNLKNSELVYPKGQDGKADMTQEPLGIRAITKSGKIINLDHEGHPVATLGGVTGKESKSNTVRVSDTVRKNLVEAGAKNAIARLNEIEKNFPNETTSILFSSHAEGVGESIMHGAVRGTQSAKQQKVDAAWASFIDEAIPVFTGGLRGSDAFRRFLISQAPTIGTKGETIQEKRRLLRANIQATADVFAGRKPGADFDPGFVSKVVTEFASNPKYWGAGVTKAKAEEAANAINQLVGGGGGSAQRISGDDEYEKLPSGARFIGPDGQERVKP